MWSNVFDNNVAEVERNELEFLFVSNNNRQEH